jgi:hypothetical protein
MKESGVKPVVAAPTTAVVSAITAVVPAAAATIVDNQYTKTILEIVSVMTKFLFVNLGPHTDFILRNTMKTFETNKPPKKVYEKMIAVSTAKKPESYEEYIGSFLIYLTLAYIHISIQTSVPSVATIKSFPGCKKAFIGYPLDESKENKDGIYYISCVVSKIKNENKVFSYIAKIKDTGIAQKMENYMASYILNKNEEVAQALTKKRDYLLTHKNDAADEEEEKENEHDIKRWVNFLPAISPIMKQNLKTVSDEFAKAFLQDMENGKEGQQEKLDIIRSKIIYFSLGIQELIQNAVSSYVKENKPILLTNLNEPYLENACCNERSQDNTYSYFVAKEPNVDVYNRNIRILNSYLLDAHRKSSAMVLFEPSDTRKMSLTLNNEFSPITMYKALIHHCSSIPNLNELVELSEICGNKKDIAKKMDDIIKMMKEKSDVYDKKVFEKMMLQLNAQNKVHIDLSVKTDDNEDNKNKAMEEIRERFTPDDDDDKQVQQHQLSEFIELLEKVVLSKDKRSSMTELSDYLNGENSRLTNNITTFITKNAKDKKTMKETISCIKQLLTFKETKKEFKSQGMLETAANEDREKVCKMETFFKNAADSLIIVYPNMMLNNVTYQKHKEDDEDDDDKNTEDDVYKRWELSTKHKNDLKKILYTKFLSLRALNDMNTKKMILSRCEKSNSDIHFLAKRTIYTHMNDDSKICISDADTLRMLYQYYLLNILSNFINVKQSIEIKKPKSRFEYDETSEDISLDRNGIIQKTPKSKKFKIKNKQQLGHPVNPETLGVPSAPVSSEDDDEEEKMVVNVDENDEEPVFNVLDITKDISLMISTFVKMLCVNKEKINYNYETLMEKIIKSKNAEKKKITDILDEMDVDERKVDKEMRSVGLGKWSVGSGRIYSKQRYDDERDELIGNKVSMTIEDVETDYNKEVNRQVEEDEYGMENIGEDNDNYGEEQERDYGDYE